VTAAVPVRATRGASLRALAAYGAFGLPLGFLALPLYVTLPDFYARQHGLGLALIGVLLLVSRLADALADPLIGRWVDGMRAGRGYTTAIMLSVPLVAGGFAGLFLAPPLAPAAASAWLLGLLLLSFAGFSLGSIAYHAWGVELAAAPAARARVVGMREGFGLAGMLLGALVPQFAGMTATSATLAALLLLTGAWLVLGAPRPVVRSLQAAPGGWLLPLRRPGFRPLWAVFVVNGIASAVPATLMPFFVRDALGAGDWIGPLLALYLVTGAATIPLWIRLSGGIGLARAWIAGMALAVATFAWAFFLPGQPAEAALIGFAVVCALSGLALGADLVLPSALLAGVIQRAGDADSRGGSYFGLWNFGAKLTLALAAGLALPLLGLLGYVPGAPPGAGGVIGLAATYCLLPCLLKLLAALLLWRSRAALAGD
jgi:GPH family glycoside/pentoside/hexuronide:cation symporter